MRCPRCNNRLDHDLGRDADEYGDIRHMTTCRTCGYSVPVIPQPEPAEVWKRRVHEYMAKRKARNALRAELAECRRLGLQARHEARLRRARGEP